MNKDEAVQVWWFGVVGDVDCCGWLGVIGLVWDGFVRSGMGRWYVWLWSGGILVGNVVVGFWGCEGWSLPWLRD